MRRGLDAMIFVTNAEDPLSSTPRSLALIPITVSIQLAKPVATVSVGEKASPLPLLSRGASVMNLFPDLRCSHSVLRSPRYVTFEVFTLPLQIEGPGCI